MITTKQLAEKYNTSMQAVRQSLYQHGHYKGYVVSGRSGKENLWANPD